MKQPMATWSLLALTQLLGACVEGTARDNTGKDDAADVYVGEWSLASQLFSYGETAFYEDVVIEGTMSINGILYTSVMITSTDKEEEEEEEGEGEGEGATMYWSWTGYSEITDDDTLYVLLIGSSRIDDGKPFDAYVSWECSHAADEVTCDGKTSIMDTSYDSSVVFVR